MKQFFKHTLQTELAIALLSGLPWLGFASTASYTSPVTPIHTGQGLATVPFQNAEAVAPTATLPSYSVSVSDPTAATVKASGNLHFSNTTSARPRIHYQAGQYRSARRNPYFAPLKKKQGKRASSSMVGGSSANGFVSSVGSQKAEYSVTPIRSTVPIHSTASSGKASGTTSTATKTLPLTPSTQTKVDFALTDPTYARSIAPTLLNKGKRRATAGFPDDPTEPFGQDPDNPFIPDFWDDIDWPDDPPEPFPDIIVTPDPGGDFPGGYATEPFPTPVGEVPFALLALGLMYVGVRQSKRKN